LITGVDPFVLNSFGMKNNLLKLATNFTVIALLGLLCAGSAFATASTEGRLLSVGFKAKAATTAKQQKELKTLPQGTLSRVTQKEKTFYVYPDVASQKLYVGSEAQYRAYQSRAPKERGSAKPIVKTDSVRGNPITVREFYGFGPLDDMR
jgi:hypothetical protein